VGLLTTCALFQNNLALLTSPYTVQAGVSDVIFGQFVSALEGVTVNITNENCVGLARLSAEFGFRDLMERATAFRQNGVSGDALLHMDALAQIAALERQNAELQEAVQKLTAEVAVFRAKSPAPTAEPTPPAPLADSTIVTEFPATVFGEFQTKRWTLLWRGTRDGFNSAQFHARCDGHVNTVTLIEDIGGYIFGGFTPLAWESNVGYKIDPLRRSFVFTLKNPCGTGAMKFSLGSPQGAIHCHCNFGPCFGVGRDISVANNSDGNMVSYTNLGVSYLNYTGRDGKTVFTGVQNYRAKEIEVFEITG
jgi:hypothetical protein